MLFGRCAAAQCRAAPAAEALIVRPHVRLLVHCDGVIHSNLEGWAMTKEEQNKKVVVDYYQTAFNGNPGKAVAGQLERLAQAAAAFVASLA